ALHNIILSGVYRLIIRKQSRTNFNPVIQHIRRALERARHNNPILFERLCKEVKRLTKNLPDTDTRDLKVEHIGLEASQLEAIMNFHGNAIPNSRQNNSNELLNSFVLDGKITSLEETVNWIKLSVDEVEKCMKILKGGKAGGICGIKNEFLKICLRNFIVELTYMFNKIITDKEIPLIWKKHMIQPIHKDDSEFRPISLIEKTRKLFEKLIFSKFEVKLKRQQAGFRLKHSTLNHALTLDTRLRHGDVEGICVTLDISKAYDSVYRKRLYEKLMIKKKFSREDTILIAALIENNELEKQVPLEYLGYYFNNKCAGTMKSLKFIRQKAVRAAVITNKLLRKTQYSNNNLQYYQSKLRMYTKFIRPHIDYYAQLFGCNEPFVEGTDRIQKGIIKYLYKIYFKTPTKILYALFPLENTKQRAEDSGAMLLIRSYTEEKKLLRWIFKPNKSKNLKNLKKNIKYIKNKIQGNEFKAKYNRWQKENLHIIRPEHKRENIIEILIKFIQHNIGHPTNGVNIGLINPQDII
ncbi:hypothetical protein CWI39_0383p0010, partial [Hamiltosporidium magnivora]